MEALIPFALLAIGAVMLFILIKLFSTPLKWAMKLFINALIGFIALFVLNFLGGFIGVSLGVNWLNAIIVGALGVPGIVLLLLLKYLF